jgi:hypothetical protein
LEGAAVMTQAPHRFVTVSCPPPSTRLSGNVWPRLRKSHACRAKEVQDVGDSLELHTQLSGHPLVQTYKTPSVQKTKVIKTSS